MTAQQSTAICNGGSITLPGSPNSGQFITVANVGSSACSIAGSGYGIGNVTSSAPTSYSLPQGSSVTLLFDAVSATNAWRVVQAAEDLEQTFPLGLSLTSTSSGAAGQYFNFHRAVYITGFDWTINGSAGIACTTLPVVGLYVSGSELAGSPTTIANGSYQGSSSSMFTAVAGGGTLHFAVDTAAAGCTTSPGSIYLMVHYLMQ